MIKKAVGNSVFSQIIVGDVNTELKKIVGERRTVIITDDIVYSFFKKIIKEYSHIVISSGESNKTMDSLDKIYSELITLGADRSTLIVGFGGGVVTDIAGFVASTYMRGIDFGFVATTLLSQVDASIGGKNGINYEGYKNMIGTFTQPSFIISDPYLLKTLPTREFSAGMAEIIKIAIICDVKLFELLQTCRIEQIIGDIEIEREIISRAIKNKISIVERDVHEKGERLKLNLGHTIAHAIERGTSKYIHGEAVSIGLSMIAEISVKLGYLSECDRASIDNLLTNMSLPTKTDMPIELIFNSLLLDKKKNSDNINIVVIKKLGDCEVINISFCELAKILNVKN